MNPEDSNHKMRIKDLLYNYLLPLKKNKYDSNLPIIFIPFICNHRKLFPNCSMLGSEPGNKNYRLNDIITSLLIEKKIYFNSHNKNKLIQK